MLVYQPGQLERTGGTSALQVRQRSVGSKDVSCPEELQHLNMSGNKAGQEQGMVLFWSVRGIGGKAKRGAALWMPVIILENLGWPFVKTKLLKFLNNFKRQRASFYISVMSGNRVITALLAGQRDYAQKWKSHWS